MSNNVDKKTKKNREPSKQVVRAKLLKYRISIQARSRIIFSSNVYSTIKTRDRNKLNKKTRKLKNKKDKYSGFNKTLPCAEKQYPTTNV